MPFVRMPLLFFGVASLVKFMKAEVGRTTLAVSWLLAPGKGLFVFSIVETPGPKKPSGSENSADSFSRSSISNEL